MIVYQSTALKFRESVDSNSIISEIESNFRQKLGRRVGDSEKHSWNNSLRFMETIVRNSRVANDCGILIEYGIPATSKRIDFIISGHSQEDDENFVIIELKQWEKANATSKENIVESFVGGNVRELTHPSYQAWSYRQLITDMNEAVYTRNITGRSCAYLHNYKESTPEPLKHASYQEILRESPLYFAHEYRQLQEFIYKYVGKGEGMDILYRIENGKIKPSKKLVDCVSSMFVGNQEFVLIDEQKVAYENILSAIRSSSSRQTIIIKGGPGTGKSVVSINAFSQLLRDNMNVRFVAPNASFRTVITETLASGKSVNRTRLKALFSGSGGFYDAKPETFDAIIVDEAHRLKGQGAYMYKGQNQVEDIVKASRISVFFIDDNQRIRPDDIGTVCEITRAAIKFGSAITEMELVAQFRCAGAEGFINWVDHTLQIRDTANYDGWDPESFRFEICDTPHQVKDKIASHVSAGEKARILAGYAWKWTAEDEGNRNGEINDVIITEHDFSMPWNSRATSTTWAIKDDGINQVGCIHTSQGLEFDYIGIIIGKDLQYDPISGEVHASYDDYFDITGRRGLRNDPDRLTSLVKNIYKVLLSRGMKGCYVYCCDKELEKYLRGRVGKCKINY
ncbi:MAG: DNA/RNA helicase domain-containing protein [Saccharofermentanales bacterium]